MGGVGGRERGSGGRKGFTARWLALPRATRLTPGRQEGEDVGREGGRRGKGVRRTFFFFFVSVVPGHMSVIQRWCPTGVKGGSGGQAGRCARSVGRKGGQKEERHTVRKQAGERRRRRRSSSHSISQKEGQQEQRRAGATQNNTCHTF